VNKKLLLTVLVTSVVATVFLVATFIEDSILDEMTCKTEDIKVGAHDI